MSNPTTLSANTKSLLGRICLAFSPRRIKVLSDDPPYTLVVESKTEHEAVVLHDATATEVEAYLNGLLTGLAIAKHH